MSEERSGMEKIPAHIHPFNFFIVSRLDEIWRDIATGYHNDAVAKLYYFTMFFEPKIKMRLADLIEEARKYIVNPSLKADSFAVKYIDELMKCLHEEGYFALAKRRFITDETFEKLKGEAEE